MISIQRRLVSDGQAPAPAAGTSIGIGRSVSIVHAVSVAVIALMALAAYVVLDRTIHVQQETALGIELTERESMLSQRIASLAAQYALGNAGVRPDLRAAISEFEHSHRALVAGDATAGLLRAGSDPALEALYTQGPVPLDASVKGYIAQARSIVATPSQNALLGGHAAALFFATQGRLLDAFNAERRIRADHANARFALLRTLGGALCAIVLATLFASAIGVFRPMARQIARLMRDAQELAGLATVDPLTGMLNKRSFQARGAIEIHKARRYGRPLSLLMIDADQLAAIETKHGRDGGEVVLKALTSSFFGGTRISDLVARVDTEQFAILLPETSCEGAQLLAERLRHKISDLALQIDDKPVPCTISVGVAAAEKDASFLWPTFKRADEALYEAKMRGRNRVVVAAAA